MTPSLRRIGTYGSALVMVDAFCGDASAVVDAAAALGPFARAGNLYPGLRRIVGEHAGAASAYVAATLEACAPLVGGAFDADGFDLIEASFSMVVDPPAALAPAQRMPHFDSTDPDYLAILHYLGGCAGTGTAFYRQRSTGIERVDADNVGAFIAAAKREGGTLNGYTNGSNVAFEQVARIDAVPDRLVIYQGALLHSGVIPPDMVMSADPHAGRLTANFFIRAYRGR